MGKFVGNIFSWFIFSILIALAFLSLIAAGFPIFIVFIFIVIRVFVLIEQPIEDGIARLVNFLRPANKELTTFRYTFVVLIIAVVIWVGLRYGFHVGEVNDGQHTGSGEWGGVKFIELASSVVNFVGVMYVARGVILLRAKSDDVSAASVDPERFSVLAADILKEASEYCERGSVLICLGFLIDIFAKAFS
ncbi:TPA: hypothetical protein QDB14_002546 [Burkholderia vietnamiensis]|nr:hypothetical protein [Burkholderia vietnamiensis]HEP6274476.1 hypothetical protein [Burkholderia vietnamiensis]HEP6283975.1 hypothetical protein [Burkholderia vietnamiensis]HEP6309441.1 hypothetical protein [Burkholderia vietnamiensis]